MIFARPIIGVEICRLLLSSIFSIVLRTLFYIFLILVMKHNWNMFISSSSNFVSFLLVILFLQPSLHKPSMMAHKVRVLYSPTQKTIRMHYASEYNNYNLTNESFYSRHCNHSNLYNSIYGTNTVFELVTCVNNLRL